MINKHILNLAKFRVDCICYEIMLREGKIGDPLAYINNAANSRKGI